MPRRVSCRGAVVIASQRIHVGAGHAGRTVTVEQAETTFRVYDGDLLLTETTRTTTKQVTRFKARKSEPHDARRCPANRFCDHPRMANVVIDDNRDDPAVVMVMLQGPSWELHVWIHLSDLGRLRSLREADWATRRSVQIGEDGAGTPVHWSIRDDTLTALIGPDDETWHTAISMPLDMIDRLAQEAAGLLPPPEPPTPYPGQLEIF